jgi:hypothetical protein
MKSCSRSLSKLLYIKVRTPSGVVVRELDAMGRLKERPHPGHHPPRSSQQKCPGSTTKQQSPECAQTPVMELPPLDFTTEEIVSFTDFVVADEDFLAKLEPVRPFQWESWDPLRPDEFVWLK